MKEESFTSAPVTSIIVSGSDVHAQAIVPIAMTDGYSVTSFRKAVSKHFKDLEKFKHFNRLELPEDVFLDNVFKYFKV